MTRSGQELIGTDVGKFTLTRLLGSGGMGEVFEAKHRFLGARVAIKVVGAEALTSPQLLERFYQEARTLAAIDHEGIVGIFDLELLYDGRPCIIMEYLDGASLDQLIQQRGHIRPDILMGWMTGWVDALAAAHAAGVIHRDIKPGNLFVTRTGRTEVLDFGIVKLMPGREDWNTIRSVTGQVFGTKPYMAPEQATGHDIDVRTDVFSLGVVMYEALTGTRPFSAKSMVDLVLEHQRGAKSVRDVRPVPTVVDRLVMKTIDPDPQNRHQDLAALAEALAIVSRELGISRSQRESAPPGRFFANLDYATSGPLTVPESDLPTAASPTSATECIRPPVPPVSKDE